MAQSPDNQLTTVITKICAGKTICITRINRMLLQELAARYNSGREKTRAVVIKQSECYAELLEVGGI